ncbi:iron chelate uptake ABC transporter family permease subunit [Streptomyces sp. 3MP-14]|uniref:Iron chelate uptake ABC transporter family permease subunit n=1 Tax=Streptomyces mimosae TaxID=2586635 RepID=A0A5N6A4K8_9ACTN|nr:MULTISPECIES: iron chelate uptake ABC transporter family permease subunit [Streptomyces]KAB8162846.1 iron chelate uptake ABC transporter family permease subunit [Streptomyces mimosae]KAB8179059.1 iron chelate uptake ABC transporter family permease subunit [Streptomyces sp. 3MP-14]
METVDDVAERAAGAPVPRRSPLARAGGLALAGVVLGCLVVLSTWLGARATGPGEVLRALWSDDGSYTAALVRELRLPRTLTGLLVGAALGAAGALMQALTRNPLADPGLLGVNAGASAAVVLAVGVLGVTDFGGFVWFAFGGALLATCAVYALGASGRGRGSPVRLVLAGAAVSACLSGLIAGVTVLDAATFDYLRFWTVGSLAGRRPELVADLVPFVLVGLVLALALTRPLNGIALGEDTARALGVNLARTRLLGVLAITLLCGSATAAAGPIGFVGLVVPLVARRLTGPDLRWSLPYAMVLAACLLLAADTAGRLVLPEGELEVGAMTAVLGAPVFVAMVRRQRGAAS